MSLRVLITGGTGLLGKNLLETAPAQIQWTATQHRLAAAPEYSRFFKTLDLSDGDQIDLLLSEVRPDWVIHTASIGSVDQAQAEPDRVRRINVTAAAKLAQACKRLKARLVFISSNAVFDGRHPPYWETDPVCPINRYGELKVEAEAAVVRELSECLIIRPILMYGWPFPGARQNVLTRWLKDFEQSKSVEVAQDIISQPLLAANCAQAIWAGVHRERSGIYHVAGKESLALDEFARCIARTFGHRPELVRSIPNSRLKLAAPRPGNTSFVTTKMERELGVSPLGITEGLQFLQRSSCVSS